MFLLGYSEAAGKRLCGGSHAKLVADLGSQPGMAPNKEPQAAHSSLRVLTTGGLKRAGFLGRRGNFQCLFLPPAKPLGCPEGRAGRSTACSCCACGSGCCLTLHWVSGVGSACQVWGMPPNAPFLPLARQDCWIIPRRSWQKPSCCKKWLHSSLPPSPRDQSPLSPVDSEFRVFNSGHFRGFSAPGAFPCGAAVRKTHPLILAMPCPDQPGLGRHHQP